jgi:outer membrane receptor protein involved in Fe transport
MTAFLTLLLACSPAFQAAEPSLTGVVVDITGSAVAGARVSSGSRSVITDTRGRFALTAEKPQATLTVHAEGFAPETLHVASATTDLRIVLRPATLAEAVTVTAARSTSRLADTAVASTTLTAATLLTSGTVTLDEALRSVPGFSLFRRSSSRVANPTTQGAGVRGLAPSGASRMLVLADGVPITDPFGSWVHWGSVPVMAIDRVELLRGGVGGELYGSEAVAGVVQVITLDPPGQTARALAEAGSSGYSRGSAYAGGRRRRWNGFVAAERMVFDGEPIVAADERGPVDTPAGVRYWSAIGDVSHRAQPMTVSARAGIFDEDRANGTPLQTNDTNARRAAVRSTAVLSRGVLTLTAYAGDVHYDQSFSAVRPARDAEALTARQRVASSQAGGDALWSAAWGDARVLAGFEFRRVEGTSRQIPFSQGQPLPAVSSGGVQQHQAGFAQLTFEPRVALSVTAGARAGAWRTKSAGSDRATANPFISPRASVSWRASSAFSLHATATWTERTPTLNELHRDFRVGNVVTTANDELEPEEAQTLEGSALWRVGEVTARVVGFWTRLDGAVTNVTISDPGAALIVRERRNAGVIRARGAESEIEWRPSAAWSVSGSLAALDSTFTQSAEPGLAGRRVPQVPRWQAALSATYTTPVVTATAEWRGSGEQFDDDRNQFVLDGGGVLNLYAAARAGRVHPFVAVENLFDVEIQVGRTPVTTVGLPRAFRAGVRLTLP